MKKLVFLIVFSVPFAGAQVQVQGTAIQIGSGAVGPAGPPGSGNVNQVTASAISFVGTNGSRQIVAAPYTPINRSGDTGITGNLSATVGTGGWAITVNGSDASSLLQGTDKNFFQGLVTNNPDNIHNAWRWAMHVTGNFCGFPQVPGSNFFNGLGVYMEFGGFQLGQPNNCPFYISNLAPNKSLFVLDDGTVSMDHYQTTAVAPTVSASTCVQGSSFDGVISGVAYHFYCLTTNHFVRVAMATW